MFYENSFPLHIFLKSLLSLPISVFPEVDPFIGRKKDLVMRHDDDLIHIDDIASVTIEKPFIQIRDQIMKLPIDNQFTAHS